jgi:hypothetical protein
MLMLALGSSDDLVMSHRTHMGVVVAQPSRFYGRPPYYGRS